MRGPCTSLTPPALALAGIILVLFAATAEAHRLEGDYRVLPGNKVQVESWFDLTGTSPKGAKVEVFQADRHLLTQGNLDDKGIFVFSFITAETLTVVISAGAGHRKELTIPEADLARGNPKEPSLAPPSPAPVPLADRSSKVSFKDILIGVGFLLAAAAFVMSIRNSQRLKDLQRK